MRGGLLTDKSIYGTRYSVFGTRLMGKDSQIVKTYEDLDVYKLAFELAIRIYKLTESFPKAELFGGVGSQIRRSSSSVGANLAEGLSKRMSKADECRFISIAMGSAEETRYWLQFCDRLGHMEALTAGELRQDYKRVCNMLFRLMEMRKGDC